jgi:hypothetical protein
MFGCKFASGAIILTFVDNGKVLSLDEATILELATAVLLVLEPQKMRQHLTYLNMEVQE